MQTISLPQKPKYIKVGENIGRFEIHGCHPGYGTTLGSALRRVLLSSMEGVAINSVKIKGVHHEFSTLSGVKEDIVQIILNLKKVRFKMYGNDSMKATLRMKGDGIVTAKDIKCTSELEVVNPEQQIATITDKKAELEMEFNISKGIGYVPVEQQHKEDKEIGVIAIDAIYTPIKRVNYLIEDMRIGKQTDFNKITLEIVTDGSITPKEAFSKSVKILIEQFSVFVEMEKEAISIQEKVEEVIENKQDDLEKNDDSEKVDPLKIKVSDLKGLSVRTLNVLEKNKINKIKDIIKMTEDELTVLDGMGSKGIKEIRKTIGEFGLTLKQK